MLKIRRLETWYCNFANCDLLIRIRNQYDQWRIHPYALEFCLQLSGLVGVEGTGEVNEGDGLNIGRGGLSNTSM